MTHYENIQLVDYVRGLVDPATAATMRSHLETCPACDATARRLDMVATVARADAQFEPPAHLLRFALARELVPADALTVEAIVHQTEPEQFRLKSLIREAAMHCCASRP